MSYVIINTRKSNFAMRVDFKRMFPRAPLCSLAIMHAFTSINKPVRVQ